MIRTAVIFTGGLVLAVGGLSESARGQSWYPSQAETGPSASAAGVDSAPFDRAAAPAWLEPLSTEAADTSAANRDTTGRSNPGPFESAGPTAQGAASTYSAPSTYGAPANYGAPSNANSTSTLGGGPVKLPLPRVSPASATQLTATQLTATQLTAAETAREGGGTTDGRTGSAPGDAASADGTSATEHGEASKGEATRLTQSGGGQALPAPANPGGIPWNQSAVAGSNVLVAGPPTDPNGFFFRWDRMYFTMTPPEVVTVGDPAQAGVFFSNGIPRPFINSFDTGFIGDSPEFGDRIEFGFIDPRRQNGWLASVLMLDRTARIDAPGGTLLFDDPNGFLLGFQDSDNNGTDDDIDGDNLYGRNGQDLGTPDGMGGFVAPFDGTVDAAAPQDNDDLVTWVPIFEELSATSYTDISGLEIMYAHTLPRVPAIHWLFGVRYVDLDDKFNLVGTGGLFDETRIDTRTQNLIIGPQIGAVSSGSIAGWNLNAELRYLPGANFISGRQSASIATNATATAAANDAQFGGRNVNRPLNLSALATSSSLTDETFSSVVEWRLDAGYALAEWLTVRAGYTGMFMSEIVRGAGNVTYSIPDLGFSSANGEDITLHALTLGLEFYR